MSALQSLCICCAITSAITLLILLINSFSSLEFNEYGLDYSSITKSINEKPYTAGIHFLGVGHSFIKFPKTVQTIEFSKEKSANSAPLKSRTSDGLEVTLEISFQYKLIYEHIYDLYLKFGPVYQPTFERMAIDILTDLATQYTAYDFFVDRMKIGTAMQQNLNEQFQNNSYATIDFFQLRSVDLPDKFEDAIQLSEVKKQDILKAYAEKNRTVIELDTLRIEAEFQKNVTVNLAAGEANAILAQNAADVDAFKLVQQAQAKSYKTLKNALKMSPEDLLKFMKAKLIRDYNSKNLTVAVAGFENS